MGVTNLPPEQEAIRAKCFHLTGTFVEFAKEEVEQSIPDRFEKIVRMYPNRIAVKTKDQTLTFNELNRFANRLAHTILARQQGQEPVAVFLPTGISQIIAILAVLKAGKMFLQLDPKASHAQTNYLLGESQARLIITNGKNDSIGRGWANAKRQLINIDDLDSGISDENPGLYIAPDAFAYIKYTSGSTGRAKGAVNSHRYIMHVVMNFTNTNHFCADDRYVHVGGNSIKRYFWGSLLNGATLSPLDITEEGAHHLADWLIEHEITIYRSFPTAFRHFVSSLSGQMSFPRLRLIRLGGEPLYRRDIQLYKKYFSSDCLLINSYSSTETGNICIYYIDKNTEITGSRVPVGYTVKGKDVLIVDDGGNDVGFNEVGEIVVKSRFLPSGYWQPNRASKNFQSMPDDPEVRIYRTGDLGQLSENGCLLHLGRKDARVKIRNFRVDIGEVEATLADHPGVKQATVIAKENGSGDTTLVAYFVPRSEPAPTVTTLRNFLTQKLPDYMIPSVFVELDSLPISATGKLDRGALPDPGRSRPELGTPFARAQTPIEKELAQIWADVLSLDQVGVHDNFFDLGGHSLAATRVVSQVIKQFQIEVPLQLLFESPTVAEMATVITQYQAKKLDRGDLDRILAELESMSDEEAQRLLYNAAERR
jgi:amino acid adenylation domain-containing protein